MKTHLFLAAFALALAAPAAAQVSVPMQGVDASGRTAREAADAAQKAEQRREAPPPPRSSEWNEDFIPEQRRDPQEMERGASAGASASPSQPRRGTDLGMEAEREEEAFRRRQGQSIPKPLNLR